MMGYCTDQSSGIAASSDRVHQVKDKESPKYDFCRKVCFVSKSSTFEWRTTHSLNKTLDPDIMPSLASTIGGPKHCDLRFRVSQFD
jgi:hypothetical protein